MARTPHGASAPKSGTTLQYTHVPHEKLLEILGLVNEAFEATAALRRLISRYCDKYDLPRAGGLALLMQGVEERMDSARDELAALCMRASGPPVEVKLDVQRVATQRSSS